MDLGIAGVNILLLVVGLVEAAKRLGLKGNGSFVLALILGTVLGVLFYLVENAMIPSEAVRWISAALFGLAVGLAGTGLYDLSKSYQK